LKTNVCIYIGKQDAQSLFRSTHLMNHLPPMTLNSCWPNRRGDAVCFVVALGEAFLSAEGWSKCSSLQHWVEKEINSQAEKARFTPPGS